MCHTGHQSKNKLDGHEQIVPSVSWDTYEFTPTEKRKKWVIRRWWKTEKIQESKTAKQAGEVVIGMKGGY